MGFWRLMALTTAGLGAAAGAGLWLLAESPPGPADGSRTAQAPPPGPEDGLVGEDFGGVYIAQIGGPGMARLQWEFRREGPGEHGQKLIAERASMHLDVPGAAWVDVCRLRQGNECMGMFALGRGPSPSQERDRKLHACGVVQGRALVLFSTSGKTWLGWTKHRTLRDDLTMQAVEVWKDLPCNLVTSASVREVKRGALLEVTAGGWTLTARVVMEGGAVSRLADVCDTR